MIVEFELDAYTVTHNPRGIMWRAKAKRTDVEAPLYCCRFIDPANEDTFLFSTYGFFWMLNEMVNDIERWRA